MAHAQGSEWPVLAACIGRDRAPTAGEIDRLASRIWRETHPGAASWDSVTPGCELHRQTLEVALVAVGMPQGADVRPSTMCGPKPREGSFLGAGVHAAPSWPGTLPKQEEGNPASALASFDVTEVVEPGGELLGNEDYAILAAFRQELRSFLRFSERAAEDAGITAQQYQALLALRAAPNRQLSVGELADQMLLLPHSTTGLLTRLEAIGMVERRRSAGDRRRVAIGLTATGCALLSSMASAHRAELTRLRPMLHGLLSRL
jgi:DNA-binding MarR family transcriptional regulator